MSSKPTWSTQQVLLGQLELEMFCKMVINWHNSAYNGPACVWEETYSTQLTDTNKVFLLAGKITYKKIPS